MNKLLQSAVAVSVSLVWSVSFAFAQCGADGTQPCVTAAKAAIASKAKIKAVAPKLALPPQAAASKTNVAAKKNAAAKAGAKSAAKSAAQTSANAAAQNEEAAKGFYDFAINKCQDYECKINNYSKAIRLNPDYQQAYYGRAAINFNEGNYDAALPDWKKSAELAPDQARFEYRHIGNIYRLKKNYDSAIDYYTRSILLGARSNAQDSDTYYERGTSYMNKENYELAIRDFTRALELKPKETHGIYNNRAYCYFFLPDYAAALLDYTTAIRLKPDEADYYRNRAATYRKMGETALADADDRKYQSLKTVSAPKQ